jgi:hypothetical protein
MYRGSAAAAFARVVKAPFAGGTAHRCTAMSNGSATFAAVNVIVQPMARSPAHLPAVNALPVRATATARPNTRFVARLQTTRAATRFPMRMTTPRRRSPATQTGPSSD